ncbi:hypothetical protein ABZW03_29745 [Kitasatospora sp. NPDC004799]|uniref:hypothetical protein n=1 Tax=Kitasatospora sp. NPDC004799 TaxID=3154460 RepID=UPI0033B05A3C
MAGTELGSETVLTTERLVVRQWTTSTADRERAFDIYSRWEVVRWLGRRLGMTGTGLTDRWYGRQLAEFRIGPGQGEQA